MDQLSPTAVFDEMLSKFSVLVRAKEIRNVLLAQQTASASEPENLNNLLFAIYLAYLACVFIDAHQNTKTDRYGTVRYFSSSASSRKLPLV